MVKYSKFNTVYNYIDVLRITNIDIKEKTWTAEFYLDLVSQSDDPFRSRLSLIIYLQRMTSLLQKKFGEER
jgi:hypothetical protein